MEINNNKSTLFNRAIIILLLFVFSLSTVHVGIVWAEDEHAGHNHAEHENNEKDHEDHDGHEDEHLLTIGKDVLTEFGIELAVAGPGVIEDHIELPGEVVVSPQRLAHMVPRFPGVVKEIHKQIGDNVVYGDVLAIIENNESLVPYEVKSLIDGVVMDVHLTKGEVTSGSLGESGVTVGNTQGFIIADLSFVWVNLSVYQKDLPYIRVGNDVMISAGSAIPEISGKISYITPFLDEKTRTAVARAVIPNHDGAWMPGLFVTGMVMTNDTAVPLMILKSAIETIEGKTVVFLDTENGFKKQVIEVGMENDLHAEVVSGLRSGQKYVSKNGFTLKAELMKSEFEDGHVH